MVIWKMGVEVDYQWGGVGRKTQMYVCVCDWLCRWNKLVRNILSDRCILSEKISNKTLSLIYTSNVCHLQFAVEDQEMTWVFTVCSLVWLRLRNENT